MNKGQIVMTLTLTLFAVGVACAQSDQTQPSAPPPAPAFGQEALVPAVSENPPISAIDQPGLEPHAAPESFLLPGLHVSESGDSNIGNSLGGSSLGTVSRGLGSLTLQKLWRNYDVAMDYIGGAAFYSQGIRWQQVQQFDMDNRINWKRGQLAIRDSFSYLPEGSFGFGTYGGGSAYSASLGNLGAGLLGSGGFGQQNSLFTGGNDVSIGLVPRLTNLGLADIVENLTPKSAITVAAGYGLVHFEGGIVSPTGVQENLNFVGSRETTGQFAYDRILTPRDQIAISYGYQAFAFSVANASLHANVIQLMYGHRISGRMDFLIGAGPQFTHINSDPFVCFLFGFPSTIAPNQCTINIPPGTLMQVPQAGNHIGEAGRITLRYRFPRTTVALSFQRYITSGSGIFAGAQTTTAHLGVDRPLNRVWSLFSDFGFAKTSELQVTGSTGPATSFLYGYAGAGLHRQFGRSLRGFVSYQFNDFSFNTGCSATATTSACPTLSQRHVGSIGLDWTPRPIRLD
jgi:hypothetical protein